MNVTTCHNSQADITFILEGTYPFVRGGVSSWIHQMISYLSDFKFSLIFLGSRPEDYKKQYYTFPKNVVHFETHYLHSAWQKMKPKKMKGCPRAYNKCGQMHQFFQTSGQSVPKHLLKEVFRLLDEPSGLNYHSFLHSECAFESIVDAYDRHHHNQSFIDYFWTVRSMHAPIFMLASLAKKIKETPIIHAASTGYAGLLGTMIKNNNPHIQYLLTEHGIYTKERKIDLTKANLNNFIKNFWIRFFEVISQLTYQAADKIYTLYEDNRLCQIQDGAPAYKTAVIPNGINPDIYNKALKKHSSDIPTIIGFIGRVVPIKDLKTFITALQFIRKDIPNIEGWIVGPLEEEPEYVTQCQDLIASLKLQNVVKFFGYQHIPSLLPQLGLVALTSISEAQPLVILEAFASGIPCVCTDVGSCKQMIEGGLSEQDKALGHAGTIVNIVDPMAVAKASIDLLTNNDKWQQARNAAFKRVNLFYSEQQVFDRYRQIYSASLKK